MSHPARGAWIEINLTSSTAAACRSHPARGAWIEINGAPVYVIEFYGSHPARGAWIEIGKV